MYPTFEPPRPSPYNGTILETAVADFLKTYEAELHSGWTSQVSAQDLLAVLEDDPYQDGYQLAKILENTCGWTCDFQTADILNSVGDYILKAHRAAVRQWAESNQIQPQFAVGTRVICLHNGEKHGVITGLSEYHAACYEIQLDGQTYNHRAIVAFEDTREETE